MPDDVKDKRLARTAFELVNGAAEVFSNGASV
jgi:hypothetical protein